MPIFPVRRVRQIRWLVAVGVLVGGVGVWGLPSRAADVVSASVERVAGADRYQTAVEVARLVGGGSLTGLDRIIVVSGKSFPDGLAASGLAGFLDDGGRSGRTAILLSRADELPGVTADAIRASGVTASNVLVVGGAAAVSDVVRAGIAVAAGWDGAGVNPVVRIAGENRYETAAAIAGYVNETAGDDLPESYRTVLVANGGNFPDALSAGTLAYRNGHVLLLSPQSSIPPASRGAIQSLGANCAVVIGGTAALSTRVASEAGEALVSGGCGVERIAGANRYETASLVADSFVALNGAPRQATLVSGVNFADALTSAPIAGRNQPLLLTTTDQLPAATSAWLTQHRNSLTQLFVIGGTTAISPTVIDQANQALTPPTPTPPRPTPPGPAPDSLTLSYASTVFSQDQTSQVITPTLVGAVNPATYEATGSLPIGVTFDSSTGQFTGPNAWNLPTTQISAGFTHTCAVLDDTTARCWGGNGKGELGDGTTASSNTPVVVTAAGGAALSGITQISAGGQHTCAVLDDKTARCWGWNSNGELGDGTNTDSATPVTVVATGTGTTLSGITQISAGDYHTCAVLDDKTARCWGAKGEGRLGDGTNTGSSNQPVTVVATGVGTTLSAVTQITAGEAHTCAMLEDTTARCWGWNAFGQLGDGTTTNRDTPVTVVALSAVTQISAGSGHTCAVLDNTTARCWGANGRGQLGDGTTTSSNTPVVVTTAGGGGTTLSAVTQISAGTTHTCARLSDGTGRCWGENSIGQLGDGTTTDRSTPVVVTAAGGAALSAVTQISAGSMHTCAQLSDGTARCWGANGEGQLGDGTTTNKATPVIVSDIGNPGWPATITIVATDAVSRTASATITLTNVGPLCSTKYEPTREVGSQVC